MAISESQKNAKSKYDKKNYERFIVIIRKDAEINRDVIRRYAESKGISVNALIRGLLEERIRNDADFVI